MGTLTSEVQQFVGQTGLACALAIVVISLAGLWVRQLHLWAPEPREQKDDE